MEQPDSGRKGRGVRLFSSVSEAERFRRPTDYVLLGLGGVLLVLSAVASDSAGATEAAAAAFIDSLPHVFDGLWAIAADIPVVWAAGLLVIAVVARARRGLVRDMLLAGRVRRARSPCSATASSRATGRRSTSSWATASRSRSPPGAWGWRSP